MTSFSQPPPSLKVAYTCQTLKRVPLQSSHLIKGRDGQPNHCLTEEFDLARFFCFVFSSIGKNEGAAGNAKSKKVKRQSQANLTTTKGGGFLYHIKNIFICLLVTSACSIHAQPDRWQQAADYKMDIDFDEQKHQFKGTQRLVYTNNSPDELHQVFYHLYFNAFQPNSMMDVRSRNISDPDPRVGDRISKLKENEMGYHHIRSLKYNGQDVKHKVEGTVLEVLLPEPIPPFGKATFDMVFESQVPVQIRRSGRNNKEGIAYSMSQWFPKMAEYDYQGWHAHPYVGREFHGVWGNFDVTIRIDRDYIVAATGVLQNPNEIGYGYQQEGASVQRPSGEKLAWHFVAEQVHDFAWAADKDYTHTRRRAADGTLLHFFYQKNERTTDVWERLPAIMDEALSFINSKFGKYPYPVYSFIQGGDGGMEYPMLTLITGERNLRSLVGVSVHELMHSWFQLVLGTNESLYPWMDEGFTSYADNVVVNHLKAKGLLPGSTAEENPHASNYVGHANFVKAGKEEPLSTHADHYVTNSAYAVASYVKGAIFLNQLEYIIGKEAFDKGMLRYFEVWKFKHPNPNDFIRIMEKVSGLELDWYKEYWINTTHSIDYRITSVDKYNRRNTKISLERVGLMPMPLDVVITKKGGKQLVYHIPLRIMRGEKTQENTNIPYKIGPDWPWTHPTYELFVPIKSKDIEKVEIDPSGRMADINKDNNVWKK